jgi:hypothetical protein
MKNRFFRFLDEGVASICHFDRLASAYKEPKAQLGFQLKNLLAQSWLHYMQSLRGSGKIESFGERDGGLQEADIRKSHRPAPT